MSETAKYKIALMGPSSAGKTSIVVRFTKNHFFEEEAPTIGAAFATMEIETDHGIISTNIWDTAGQERYKSLIPKYARGASAIIVVYDITDRNSFLDAQDMILEQKPEFGLNVSWFLVGNKIDLLEEEPSLTEVHAFIQEQSIQFVQTSAKTGQNIQYLFQLVGNSIVKNYLIPQQSSVDLNQTNAPKNKCC